MSAAAASIPATGFVTISATKAAPAVAKTEVTDEALFERALAGDREALGQLISRYEQPLFGLLVRMTNGDRHLADDIFQETFLHAMRAATTFNRKLQFKPWITAIAVNLVRDDARKRKVRGEITLEGSAREDDEQARGVSEPACDGETPGETAERRDDEAHLKKVLQRLTLLEREVILLHFYNGMTLVETAATLGVPLGTVKSRLHAALTRLGSLLGNGQNAEQKA